MTIITPRQSSDVHGDLKPQVAVVSRCAGLFMQIALCTAFVTNVASAQPTAQPSPPLNELPGALPSVPLVARSGDLPGTLPTADTARYAGPFDQAVKGVFEARETDWRNGAVVYQVLVDRFVPPTNLGVKRGLYPAPKILRPWSEEAKRGKYLPQQNLWSHEIDFWGGDLPGVQSKLSYLKDLNVDVLYLNPIHLAYTNHKYDALDYLQIAPELGTWDDFKSLTQTAHQLGIKVVLDGVFNHMGRNSLAFQQALSDPQSTKRDWFYFGPQYPGGARSWAQATNLPELNLENPTVRDHIYAKPESVVQTWLRAGADGWRLDVGYEIGPRYLSELTQAAHAAKPGSLVIGEVANYPKEWFPALDAVINFTVRDIIINAAKGMIAPPTASKMIARTIEDAGIEPMLKSWLMLDNHDNHRLATVLPARKARQLAQVLQFTLPGSPNLYYGTEVEMTGGEDPAMRSPMRWDRVTPGNAALAWNKRLIALHQAHRALRVGNYREISADKLIAFERFTDRVGDSVIVLVNPSQRVVTERILIPNSKLMNGSHLMDILEPMQKPIETLAGLATVSLPAQSFRVLAIDIAAQGGYTAFKRVQ